METWGKVFGGSSQDLDTAVPNHPRHVRTVGSSPKELELEIHGMRFQPPLGESFHVVSGQKTIWLVSCISRVPIGSMYGIFTYIYHKNQPNVGVDTIHGSYRVGPVLTGRTSWLINGG